MPRKGFCPHCRSMQPLAESYEEGQTGVWCDTCRNPIEDAPAGRAAPRPRPATVLCVDDDRIVLGFCSDALERHGFRTIVASDGTSGIELARRDRPDVILLDVMMPGMNGFDVCRRLRAEPSLRDTPIILLTASEDPDLAVKSREAGATSSMRKPWSAGSVISAVEQALGRPPGPVHH